MSDKRIYHTAKCAFSGAARVGELVATEPHHIIRGQDGDSIVLPDSIEQLDPAAVIYCPICGREIIATNYNDTEADGFVFAHDDIDHDDSGIDAISRGMQ